DSTMVALASQGLGIALMPELTVDAVPHGARVIGLDERIERVIGVAVQPGALKIPAVRVFLDAVRGLFPESAVPALSTMWGRTAEVGRSVTTLPESATRAACSVTCQGRGDSGEDRVAKLARGASSARHRRGR